MAEKTVLITGHKGFIGGHLQRTFENLGVQVIGFDIKDGKDKDIRVREYWLPDADWCFHLAALTDARSNNYEADVRTNILGTMYVLEQYKDKVVFASSSAVNYPTSSYAISKMACEYYCALYGARIVRLCNIYGEGGHGVMEKFAAADVLTIAGDGEQIRTFAPVDAAVAALVAAPTGEPGSMTILEGEDMTVNEVASRYFPDKPITFIERQLTDIEDGRQICP
jgi:dTDP-glucose 4,6-dehydratase/UDP-glucose 4-epimerase